jgi:hypothetical protein
MCLLAFSGCSSSDNKQSTPPQTTDTDSSDKIYSTSIWDGSIATKFESGIGSDSDPYIIASASQLAFLAKEINSGKDYSCKHFSIACDIDLNNIEWTPIGDGINSFKGTFDGNSKTIKNLKSSSGATFNYEYPTGKKTSYYALGLFATLENATIKNIRIDGAEIKAYISQGVMSVHVGVLSGSLRTLDGTSSITNVKINNAKIITDFESKSKPRSLNVGGLIGHVYGYDNTSTTISLVDVNSNISLDTSYGSTNYVGTILGCSLMSDSTFTLQDCASYQTLSVSPEQYYYTLVDSFCGAIGAAQASSKPFNVKNIFSKLTLNKPVLESNLIPPSAIVSHAIIGDAYWYVLKDDPSAVGYVFENTFGCVEHMNTETGEKEVLTDLYLLPEEPTFSQTNCQGCEVLPENHGFDTDMWDLSDLTRPKLK